MRVAVTGGRDYADRDRVYEALNRLHSERGIDQLIHGGCPTGADEIASAWAWRVIPAGPTSVHADWAKGRKAGPIRNGQILDRKPDLLVAFPGGRGTADMVRQARRRGVPILFAGGK